MGNGRVLMFGQQDSLSVANGPISCGVDHYPHLSSTLVSLCLSSGGAKTHPLLSNEGLSIECRRRRRRNSLDTVTFCHGSG